MASILTLIADNLADRINGPMSVRIFIQPAMAVFFAVKSGIRDAKEGKPPYFWSLFADAEHRRALLRDGWKSIGKVFILAVLLDAIYQFIVQRFIYPVETLVIAFLLALLPYLVLRGLVTRFIRLF